MPSTDEPQAGPVDLKAAMKAAIKKPLNLDPEFNAALVVLEPLLHPDELAQYSENLNQTGTPAQRWKMRRHT